MGTWVKFIGEERGVQVLWCFSGSPAIFPTVSSLLSFLPCGATVDPRHPKRLTSCDAHAVSTLQPKSRVPPCLAGQPASLHDNQNLEPCTSAAGSRPQKLRPHILLPAVALSPSVALRTPAAKECRALRV